MRNFILEAGFESYIGSGIACFFKTELLKLSVPRLCILFWL